VTFDVGGTLIECWPSVGHIYAEVAAQHTGKTVSAEVLNRRFAAAWRTHKNFQYSTADWAALVDATFDGLLDTPPSKTFFPHLYERFSEPESWHVFEDVRPVLDELAARGLKLGIISNWDARLRPLLHGLELARYFQAIVISCELGASKPAVAIFEAAAQKLALPAGEILHVGDSLQMDACGAQAVGLQGLWLQRGIAGPGAGGISSLHELI